MADSATPHRERLRLALRPASDPRADAGIRSAGPGQWLAHGSALSPILACRDGQARGPPKNWADVCGIGPAIIDHFRK